MQMIIEHEYGLCKLREKQMKIRESRISHKCTDNEREQKLGRFPMVRMVQFGDALMC